MKLKLRENADINVVTGISDIIIDSINKKWDNIRDFNSIIVNLNEEGYEDLVPVIQSILEDENKNVGKLQQLVELISPNAKSIDDGKQEAIDELDNTDIKVEEMKLSENFPNVPEKVSTNVDPVFGKAVEDKERDDKEKEAALKENEKLAKETIPKEGETGKKVTSPALKAMHLSEALFDEDVMPLGEDLSEHGQLCLNVDISDAIEEVFRKYQNVTREEMEAAFKYAYDDFFKNATNLAEDLSQGETQNFNSDVYHALEDVAFKWRNKQVTPDEWAQALEWFEFHFIDDGEWEEYNESLTEAFGDKKAVLEKQLINFLSKKEFENKFKISDEDKREFISRALKTLSKVFAKDEHVSGEEVGDLVNRLFKLSFAKDGSLMTESVKFDIAKEQIKRFKEGKMPKDWSPEHYIKELIKKNHLTKEEGQKLLSESTLNEDLTSKDDFRSEMKKILQELKQAYYSLSDNTSDGFDTSASIIKTLGYEVNELSDAMQNFNWTEND